MVTKSGPRVGIIGAGVAGLCTAAYLQKSGFQTEIFEAHSIPGGLCTAWDRKGYTIDGCVHWLVGSSPGSGFYPLWNELIDMESIRFVREEAYFVYEGSDGERVTFYVDPDRLEAELLRIAPGDARRIRSFTDAIRKFRTMELPVDRAPELYTAREGLRLLARVLPYFPAALRWNRMTASDFASRLKSPLLRRIFLSLFEPEMPLLFMVANLAWMANGDGGYPVGGSLAFARKLEESCLESGVKIHYNSPVQEILVEENAAAGIRLSNGGEERFDIIISAADRYNTVKHLLQNRYSDPVLDDVHRTPRTFPSFIQVSLGINHSLDQLPPSFVAGLREPFRLDIDTILEELPLRTFHFDPDLAPGRGRLVTALLPTRAWEYWLDLRENDRSRYRSEKERIARSVICELGHRTGIENLEDLVEMVDVSTPATALRYTNNWQGSYEGWIPRKGSLFQSLPRNLPGLSNFFMAGHWVEPGGGLPSALRSGRIVAEILAKRESLPFLGASSAGKHGHTEVTAQV